MRPRRRKSPPPARRSRVGLWIGALLMLAVAAAFLVLRPGPAPEFVLPEYPAMEALDPRVRAAVEQALDRARGGDATAVGELGRTYHANELFALARRCYERAAALDPGRPEWGYYLARIAADEGDLDVAIRRLRDTTRAAPEFAPAWYHLGNALLERGELAGADRAFERYAVLAPDRAWGYLGRAKVARRQGRDVEALALLNSAVALPPQVREVVYLLATTSAALGRSAEAEAAFARFDDLPDRVAPRDPWMDRVAALSTGTLEALRRAQRLERESAPDRAEALYRDVLAREPDHYAALANLGNLLKRQGRLDEAGAVLRRAADADPAQGYAYALLAGIHLQQGRPADALSAATAAVKRDPGAANAQFYLGTARLALGRHEQAIEPLRRAVQLEPRLLDARVSLAACYERLDRRSEAEAELRAVLEAVPQHPAARAALNALQRKGAP